MTGGAPQGQELEDGAAPYFCQDCADCDYRVYLQVQCTMEGADKVSSIFSLCQICVQHVSIHEFPLFIMIITNTMVGFIPHVILSVALTSHKKDYDLDMLSIAGMLFN